MLSLSLNLLIPASVIASCAILAIFSFFISLRKRFPIKVNCWFCNVDTKVPFNNQNCFVCPSCSQYNGFQDDGGYNREITEQFNAKLNSSFCQKSQLKSPPTNGLCEPCNRNQEMKIIQLANFKPRIDENFDEEVEEYRQKLEDSYQLCQSCQRHLNKTLNRIKTKFIGSKISQIVSKGVKILKPKSRQVRGKLAMALVLLLSVSNLIRDFEISLNFLHCQFYYHIVAFRLTVVDLLGGMLRNLELGGVKDIDGVATSAILLNFFILTTQKGVRAQTIASMLIWSLKMVLTEVPANPAVKGSVAVILVLISLLTIFKSQKPKEPTLNQSTSFRKLHTEVNDESDTEISDFDGRSVTSFNSCIRDRTLVEPVKSFSVISSHASTSRILNSTFGKPSPSIDHSFSIRQEVSAADRNQVNKGIDQLNISGGLLGSTSTLKDFSMSRNLNPFSLENSRCGSPTPSLASVFSGSNRTQIITPPRLLEPSYSGEASWVAGGYWSSPQKRYFNQQEMSRSSSQSSGLGTIADSEKNSRENSMGRDDVTSIFSEPVGLRRRNLFMDSRPRSMVNTSSNNFFLSNNTNSFRNYRETNFFK